VNPVLQHREWLIQPDALQSMAASLRGLVDRGGFLPRADPESSLLSVDEGVGVVAIEGPILRKPDLFARVFFGAADSEESGEALREAGQRPDVKAVFLDIDSPGGTVLGTPELAAAVATLNEESAAVTSLRGEVESLTTRIESLTGERDAATGQVATLQARVTELEASQTDFDRRLQTEVARVVASTGTTVPARVTPAGDQQSAGSPATLDQLVAEYDRLVTERKPEEAAAFFQKHLQQHFTR
jgi:hypothetical protein